MRTEDYHSGDDVELVYLDWTYRFARDDFAQRLVEAALTLELTSAPVDPSTCEELVTIATTGSIDGCRTAVAERIGRLQADADGDDPIYWLRKLVFRSAWLDHRVKHGLVEMHFDDRTGSFAPARGPYSLPSESTPRFDVAIIDEEGR